MRKFPFSVTILGALLMLGAGLVAGPSQVSDEALGIAAAELIGEIGGADLEPEAVVELGGKLRGLLDDGKSAYALGGWQEVLKTLLLGMGFLFTWWGRLRVGGVTAFGTRQKSPAGTTVAFLAILALLMGCSGASVGVAYEGDRGQAVAQLATTSYDLAVLKTLEALPEESAVAASQAFVSCRPAFLEAVEAFGTNTYQVDELFAEMSRCTAGVLGGLGEPGAAKALADVLPVAEAILQLAFKAGE